ncbi:MAG TPA: NrfD/PsrC family molybdoenzyme membrane anchor subunit [Polyangiaceae bacterium]|nr:NrfD/PsrC family molybdoenzyme membrane anchor subunit [Polyangiaceae bacterium]
MAAPPLILGAPTDRELSDRLLSGSWTYRGNGWKLAFSLTFAGTLVLFTAITYTVWTGIGVWGNNVPVAWAFGIINFVWWIGIGHAGTFISAVLHLFEQRWRASINRFAEAMTLFAVIQAALFPLLHLGRPWFGYWLFPYPSTTATWPQVKSALPWDAAAISTYFTVSLLFWYLGLLPDLASIRDSAPERWRRRLYGIFALGFRGSERTWRHYRAAYLVLAGLATPLVLSVHSIVSSDFAMGLTPGWHSTIFPPYFVAGAIFSGFAMVLTLVIPARVLFRLEHVITERHLENCAKLILATGLMVSYGYLIEYFIAWYSGNPYEIQQFLSARPTAPGSLLWYVMLLGNVLVPQLFWSRKLRRNVWVLFWASIAINVGMWAERFVIIVLSLEREFLPSKWESYSPTWVDLTIFFGTIFFFLFLFLLFLRFIPIVSASEVKELRHELHEEHHHGEGRHAPHAAG